MTQGRDTLESSSQSGTERLPDVLDALRCFGRPSSLVEIYSKTSIHPVSLGKLAMNCPKSLRVIRRFGKKSKAGSWIIEPHPDLSRHWPGWISIPTSIPERETP